MFAGRGWLFMPWVAGLFGVFGCLGVRGVFSVFGCCWFWFFGVDGFWVCVCLFVVLGLMVVSLLNGVLLVVCFRFYW